MKLLHKTTLYYVIISIPLVGLAAFLSYFVIKSEIKNGAEEVLYTDFQNAKKIIRSFNLPQNIILSSDGLSKIILSNKPLDKTILKDTTIFDPIEKETIEYSILKSNYTYKNQLYQIDIVKNNIEDDELLEGLWSGFGILLLLLGAAFLLLNWITSKSIWKPFYKTIQQLENYDIKKHDNFQLESVSIYEFNQLNATLNTMTHKIQDDFNQHKEFTENASHEMQTPLAVIKANLSLLMQSSNLSEGEMNSIEAIENTVKKLSALNRTLLLLTKIDNQQFSENTNIDLTIICKNILDSNAEIISAKELILEIDFKEKLEVTMNETLAEILVSNLIQNAFRHNVQGGKLELITSRNSLSISNSGDPLSIPESDLFVRFRKSETTSESMGLGLSLVKSVVDVYRYTIRYEFSNNLHTFKLTF
jgi:signal transduction histidine kinase